jgi:hypothetical protein
VCVIRNDIADLMEHYLQRSEHAKEEALPYLIDALGSLTFNAISTREITPVGLYTCLIDLEKAIATIEANPKQDCINAKGIEHVTYAFLLDALIALRKTSAFHDNRDTRKLKQRYH